MRKLIAPMIAAGLVLAFSLQPSADAQSATLQPAPSGADLEAKAKAFLSAMQSHSAEHVFEQLAPWRKNEVELYRARIAKAVRAGNLKWERTQRRLSGKHGLDPANKLNLQSLEDLAALAPAQLFGLTFGTYRLANDVEASRALADQWFVTDRRVGLAEFRDSRRDKRNTRNHIETLGTVFIESVDGGVLVVNCVSEGREWFVIEAAFETDIHELAVTSAMEELSENFTGGRDVIAEEGEQLLGSMKNRAKVAYVKTNGIPKKLTGTIGEGGGCGVREPELEGTYYKVRDEIYTTGTKYALVCEPLEGSDPWLLFLGEMTDPAVDSIVHYDSKAELDSVTEKIKRGEWPKFVTDEEPEPPKEVVAG